MVICYLYIQYQPLTMGQPGCTGNTDPQSGPSQADSSMAPTLSKSMKHSALFMIRSISAVETCRRKTVWRIIHNDLCINCFCLASNIMCIFMVP